ncbi:hypothetical protein M9Y10_038092 [Tritrichomonas musculus]|uniref:F-box domain-containing protein n=1 Tax=Tritrichomonas musculus TaxID=1915356 RepID=A0ABR2K849_9EUKA
MVSRGRLHELTISHFNFNILPNEIREKAEKIVSEMPLDQFKNTSDKIRYVLNHDLWTLIEPLSDTNKCFFFKCSKTLFSIIINSVRNPKNSQAGRLTKLLTESEQKIREWLEIRAEKHDFPTKHEFKEICVFYLEQQKFDQNFSKNYFNELLRRIAPDYEVRLAKPVDYNRVFLTKKHLEDYFKTFKDIGIERIFPRLIINLDETGFGVPKVVV